MRCERVRGPSRQTGDQPLLNQTPRIEDRTKVMIRARLRGPNGECDACVLDISSRGLAASTTTPPARGEFVELLVGRSRLVGQVRWTGQRRFGVSLSERVSVISVIANEGEPAEMSRRVETNGRGANTAVAAREGRNRIEFIVFMAIAAAATLTVADYARTTLSSLSIVESKLAVE